MAREFEGSKGRDKRVEPRLEIGGEESISSLFARTNPSLLSYARTIHSNAHVAEDAVQEAWVGFMRQRERPTRAVTYLRRSVHNTLTSGYRRERLHREAVPRLERDGTVYVAEPDQETEVNMILTRIMGMRGKGKDKLSDIQLEVFLLSYAGYSEKEIAEKLNIVNGTVKSHLSRARAKIQRELEGWVER